MLLLNLVVGQLSIVTVSGNGETIRFVPSEYITREMCLAAAATGYESLQWIPKKHIDYEMCMAAVKGCGENIRYIPDEFMSSEIGLAAVKSPGSHMECMSAYNLQHIPKKYITKEIVIEVLNRAAYMYDSIPDEFKTPEMLDEMLEDVPALLRYMKEQTTERCMRILKKNIENARYMRKSSVTKEIAQYILLVSNVNDLFYEKTLTFFKQIAEGLVNDNDSNKSE
jgi:hypothetical protein